MTDSTFAPCEVRFFFGDGEHLFRLPLKQIAELQEKCGGLPHGAIGAVFERVETGQYAVADLVETIRLGLIGGGMDPAGAYNLVHRYAIPPKQADGEHSLQQLWTVARAVLHSCIVGFEPKKKDGTPTPETDGSTTQTPSPTVQSAE